MEQTTFFETKSLEKRGGKRKKKEESLQISLANYLRNKYPDLIFNSDLASGMKLPIWIAAKARAQRSSRGMPDLVILEPRGKYAGITLELKNEVSDVYLKDGVTISDAKSKSHVREQATMLKRLRDKGYWADFGFGISDCKKKIDSYMAL